MCGLTRALTLCACVAVRLQTRGLAWLRVEPGDAWLEALWRASGPLLEAAPAAGGFSDAQLCNLAYALGVMQVSEGGRGAEGLAGGRGGRVGRVGARGHGFAVGAAVRLGQIERAGGTGAAGEAGLPTLAAELHGLRSPCPHAVATRVLPVRLSGVAAAGARAQPLVPRARGAPARAARPARPAAALPPPPSAGRAACVRRARTPHLVRRNGTPCGATLYPAS